jgi:hypothetical protein
MASFWSAKAKGEMQSTLSFKKASQRDLILCSACDMGEAHIWAIHERCASVTLVLDRLHVVKAINAALRSLLALKLFGSARHSHVMSYILDNMAPRSRWIRTVSWPHG